MCRIAGIFRWKEHVGAKHGVALCASCNRLLMTMERIWNLWCVRPGAVSVLKKPSKYGCSRSRGSEDVGRARGHDKEKDC